MKLFCVLLAMILLISVSGCKTDDDSNSSSLSSNSSQISSSEVESMDSSSNATNIFSEKNEQQAKVEEILKGGSTDSFNSLIKKTYPQNELIKNVVFGKTDNFNTMLDRLNEAYPVECIRVFDDGSLPYCIYKLKEGGLLYIFFHGDSLKFADYAFVVKDTLTKSSFDSIIPGKTLADVEKIDSGVKLYNSLHADRIIKLQSFKTYHLVKEGFISISYELTNTNEVQYHPENLIVQSVTLIPNKKILISGNKYTLLQQDYWS